MTATRARSTGIKAEIKDLRNQIDAIFADYRGREEQMPEDVTAELDRLDSALSDKLEAYSEAAQREDRAASNREAMNQIFGGDSTPQPVSDGSREVPSAHGLLEPVTVESLANMVMNHPEFKSWYQGMTNGGTRQITENVGVRSPMVNLERSFLEPQAALITGLSSSSGGALVVNDRLNTIVPAIRDELRVVDLVTRQTTSSDTVEYVRIASETNNAAEVLEATSSSDGLKPESAVALQVVTAVVETIAHWIPITRRAASDASQLMSYINDFLTWGLLDRLNHQILNGDGDTPELEGVAETSGIQTQAWNTDILTTTRKARTKVRTVGGANPTAFVMTPESWEEIDLLKDNEARYYFGGPQRVGAPVLWGLPVIEEEAVAANTAFVADWRMGVIWDREQATLYMTDSHSDFFVRNILVILAEMRAAFGLLRPSAFVEIAMTSG